MRSMGHVLGDKVSAVVRNSCPVRIDVFEGDVIGAISVCLSTLILALPPRVDVGDTPGQVGMRFDVWGMASILLGSVCQVAGDLRSKRRRSAAGGWNSRRVLLFDTSRTLVVD